MRVILTPGFAGAPYTAYPSGGANDWWFVTNKDGFNCVTFPGKRGAKFTTEERAKEIAKQWNAQAKTIER